MANSLSARERFIACLGNQLPRKGDAVVLMQGDGMHRVGRALQMFNGGFAPYIILVGGADDLGYGSYPSRLLRDSLKSEGVPDDAIIFEETSPHTWAEANRVIEIAESRGWKELIIVSSPHHIFRAYLTFVAALKHQNTQLLLHPSTAAELPWFAPNAWGVRAALLDQEFERIEEYRQKGHVASFAEGLAYLEWRETFLS